MDFGEYLTVIIAILLIGGYLTHRRHTQMVALLKDIKMELIAARLEGRPCTAERVQDALQQLRQELPEAARNGAGGRNTTPA